MNIFSFFWRSHLLLRLAAAILSLYLVVEANAQSLERDAVTVPVSFQAKYDIFDNSEMSPGFTIELDSNTTLSGGDGPEGWNETARVTAQLKPGKDHILSITDKTEEVGGIILHIDAPAGYRVYIDDVRRTRKEFWDGQFKVRVEAEAPVPFGQGSSLRPGKVVWTVGVGNLSNGRPAGEISLRELDLTSSAFAPSALSYDTSSPEVERILASGVLRQVYAVNGLVDITADNSYRFRLKFYSRNSGQIGSKTNGVYTLTGDPLYEYIVENPVHPTTGSKIRVTRVVRQGGSTLETWTEMQKHGISPNFNYTTIEWVDKPSGGTTVSGPVMRVTGSYNWNNGNYTVNTNITDGTTTALSEGRTYAPYLWGSELASISVGNRGENFGYANARVSSRTPSYMDAAHQTYYSDFDRSGQIHRTFKSFGTTMPNTSNPAVAEVTTADFEADWTGRKTLPKSLETRVNNVVTSKFEVTYANTTVVDSSRTYSPASLATMPVLVATRKDYYDATHFLTTVTKSYRDDADSSQRFFSGLPYSVERPDGTMAMHFYYRGTFSVANRTFSVSTSGAEVLRLTVNGTATSTGAASFSTFMLDGQTSASLPQSFPSGHVFYVVPQRSTAQAIALAADGTVIASIDYICTGTTGSPSWQIVRRDVHHYSAAFFLERTSRDSGSVANTWDIITNSWTKGRLDYTIDENGVRTDFTYDNVGRIQTKTGQGATSGTATIPTLVTTYTYDAAGNVLTEVVSSSGTAETLTTIRTFDNGGRLTSEKTAGYPTAGSSTTSSVTTTHTFNDSSRIVTTTIPGGGTRIEERSGDGRLRSVTGTGVVAEYYSYAVETDGRLKTTVRSATVSDVRLRETWTDWLGRTAKTSRPGFTGQPASEEANFYDDYLGTSSGRLVKTTKTGFAPTLREYNSMSQLVRSGLDVDSGNALVLASTDRITDTNGIFEFHDSAWWKTRIVSTYPFSGGSAGTAKETGKTRERLTGLTATLRSETRSYDVEGNETRVTVTVDSANKLVTSTTRRPGMATDQVEKSLAGLAIEATGHDGLVVKKRYDALARLEKEIEPRTGSETVPTRKIIYHTNTSWPKEMKDAANKRLSFSHYDGAGRVIYTEDALGKTTRTSYTARGEVEFFWGTATYPVSYVYNAYGERTKLRTYRDPSNAAMTDTTTFPSLGAYDETSWEFDAPSGLLRKKIDAKGKFVEYTYNTRGQTAQRFWSRTLPSSSTRVSATFSYDSATGEHTGITYNDGTPSVSYTYTRSGQLDSSTDATGTRDYIYDPSQPLRLSAEALDTFYGSRVLTRTYESSLSTNTGDTSFTGHTIASVPGRARGFQLGTLATPAAEQEVVYAMSNAGRLAGLVSKRDNGATSRTFVYGYEPNSALVKTLSIVGHPFFVTRDFEPYRDLLTNIEARWSTTTRTRYAYLYDDRRQRESVVQSGDVFADYGGPDSGAIHQIYTYNSRGELTGAGTFLGATANDQSQPLSARKHEFDYDGIGNRRWSNTSGTTALRDDYNANELNQYTTRDNNTLAVGGTVANDPDIKVAVGTTAATLAGRRGRHWGDNVTVENSVAPFQGPIDVYALNPTSNKKAVETRTAFLPPLVQSFTYDEDGNLVSDGVWHYEWDAENRIWAMQTTANAVMGGVPAQRLEFKYDSMHRRVEKLKRGGWNGSVFTTIAAQTRYCYDGWNVVSEYAVTSLSPVTLASGRCYTWGLDIATDLAKAGGVGALLEITDHPSGSTYLPAYDGNGSVVVLFAGSTGSVAAAYEYSPYGEFLRCEGNYAKENPFRFSTKFTDDETGLVYYGRRYYSTTQGRFLGRDPFEEYGGLNLHAVCGNDLINNADFLGLFLVYDTMTFLDGINQMFHLNLHVQDYSSNIEQIWTDNGNREWVRIQDRWTFEVIRTPIFDSYGNEHTDVKFLRSGVTYVSVVSSPNPLEGGVTPIHGYVTDDGKTNIGSRLVNMLITYHEPNQYSLGNQLSGLEIGMAGIHNVFSYSPLSRAVRDLYPELLAFGNVPPMMEGGGMEDATIDIVGAIGALRGLVGLSGSLSERLAAATARDLVRTLNLPGRVAQSGMTLREAADFFGWGSRIITKPLSSFSRQSLEAAGWNRERLLDVARAYRQLAQATPNPSAALRAEQMENLAKLF